MEKNSLQQSDRPMGDRVAIVIATALGAGYSPIAPGTAGSALSVGLWLVLYRWYPASLHIPAHLALILALTIVGIWASTRSESWFGEIDPHQTVIDEVVGQQITYLGLLSPAISWKSLALGFFLFRLFDVWKPYPIRKIQDLHGGTGIVLDDVAAGIYAFIVLLAVRKLFGW
ncbi:MAG: phosphatidylglycerophosphatase A [Terriglobia bacterium]